MGLVKSYHGSSSRALSNRSVSPPRELNRRGGLFCMRKKRADVRMWVGSWLGPSMPRLRWIGKLTSCLPVSNTSPPISQNKTTAPSFSPQLNPSHVTRVREVRLKDATRNHTRTTSAMEENLHWLGPPRVNKERNKGSWWSQFTGKVPIFCGCQFRMAPNIPLPGRVCPIFRAGK